jgi:hypothetical protein
LTLGSNSTGAGRVIGISFGIDSDAGAVGGIATQVEDEAQTIVEIGMGSTIVSSISTGMESGDKGEGTTSGKAERTLDERDIEAETEPESDELSGDFIGFVRCAPLKLDR